MAIIQGEYNIDNGTGYDTVYLKTKAELVETNDGDDVETILNSHSESLADITTNGIKLGTGTRHGYFSILATRTTIDWHGFEDWGVFNVAEVSELGYCCFDAKATLNNTTKQSHLVGYQARNILNGAGGLDDYMHGYDCAMVYSGGGSVPIVAGMRMYNTSGGGHILAQYGLKVENLTGGDVNYAIHTGTGFVHFGDKVDAPIIVSNTDNFALNYGTDGATKTMTIGYGTGGTTGFGTINFYDGKSGLIASMANAGMTMSKSLFPYKRTYAQLFAGTEGAVIYCTNALKVGETTGNGTGCLTYWSNGAWKRMSDDTNLAS